MNKNLYLYIFTFLILLGNVNSWNLTNNQTIRWEYDVIGTTISGSNLDIHSLISNSDISKVEESFSECPGGNELCYILAYPENETYVMRKWYFNGTGGSSSQFSFLKYRSPNDLSTNRCEVNLTNFDSTIYLNSNLKKLNDYVDINYYYQNTDKIPDYENKLNKYYYMKTHVKADLINSSGGIVTTIYPNEVTENNYSYGGYPSNNYVLAKPDTVPLTFDFLNDSQILTGFGAGNYYWNITATPIDGKCYFDDDKVLTGDVQGDSKYSNGSNIFQYQSLATFTVFTDIDNDGFDDIGIAGKGNDLCPSELGSDLYQGCPTEYTSLECNGDISFNGSQLRVTTNDWGKELYFDKSNYESGSRIVNKRSMSSSNIYYPPVQGSGFYSFYDGSLGDDGWQGYCKLRYNAVSSCVDLVTGFTLSNGNSHELYKYRYRLPQDDADFSKVISCSNEDFIYNNLIFTDFFNYSKFDADVLGDDYKDFRRATDGSIYKLDDKTRGKISCGTLDENTDDCKVLIGDNRELINLPTTTIPKTIKIYQDDILIRNDTIDAKLLAMNVQGIKTFSSKDEIQNYVDKSYNLMNQFDIEKHLNYNSINNETTVTIKLKNVQDSDKTDLVIYQILSKDDITNFDDIKFTGNGNAELIIEDKDPVIGWYFNESGTDESINYTIPGNNEGGIIIITQESILLNQGELIINYRENGCQGDETALFDLSGLENSNIDLANSGKLYTVCITHIDSIIAASISNTLQGNSIKDRKILSYNNLASINYSKLINKVHLSTSTNDIYWNLLIQNTNPDGNYSCIGSFNDLYKTSDVTFGDCGFKANNKLWIHLGADYYPPITTLTIPYLSHTTKVVLTVDDGYGSGVASAEYRIDGGAWVSYTNKVEFTLTCDNDWGCKKLIEYTSTDIAGNVEDVKTYNLNIVDKASACESSCLSKPSPNRYLKECRNLNGCTYYPFNNLGANDDGVYVAEQCHFQIKGSKVKFNSTHDITCPNGPITKSKNTNEQFFPLESYCDNIKTTSYPVILNGEQVLLDIVYCIDPYKNN